MHLGYIKGSQVKPLAIAMDAQIIKGSKFDDYNKLDNVTPVSSERTLPAKLAIDGGRWPLVEVEE